MVHNSYISGTLHAAAMKLHRLVMIGTGVTRGSHEHLNIKFNSKINSHLRNLTKVADKMYTSACM